MSQKIKSDEFIKSNNIDFNSVLSHGAISEIAEKTGKHRLSVSKILKGGWDNWDVVNAALKMINKDIQDMRKKEGFLTQFKNLKNEFSNQKSRV